MADQFTFDITGSDSENNNLAVRTAAVNTSASTITSNFYRVKIEKVGENQFTIINPNDSPNANISFTFNETVVPPVPRSGTRVVIFADVHNTTAIKYVTEFENGFIVGDFVLNTQSSYIKFERRDIGEQYSSTISTINGNSFTNQDARYTLSGGDFKINIVASKNKCGSSFISPCYIFALILCDFKAPRGSTRNSQTEVDNESKESRNSRNLYIMLIYQLSLEA